MPAYNESLDLLNTFGTKWQATPGLDLDAEIADAQDRSSRPSGTRAADRSMTAPSVARPRRLFRRRSGLAWRRARWGYVFIAPWIIGFLLFTRLPMIATLAFTFTNINLSQEEPLRFVGLHNYATLVGDQQTWDSLIVTFKFALLALPVAVGAAVRSSP